MCRLNMKKKQKYIWLSAFVYGSLLIACTSTNVQHPQKTYEYLFLGHTYQPDAARQKIDSRVEQINFSNYNLILLGGDITEKTTLERSNLYYVDSIFDLKSSKTHWAVGNHDLSHPEHITEFTGKPLFYAFCKNNITFVVLNSQNDSCRITGQQLKLVKAVIDTIRQSSHLMLLQHKLVWLYGHPELEKMQHFANGGLGNEHWQVRPNNFHSEIPYAENSSEKRNSGNLHQRGHRHPCQQI